MNYTKKLIFLACISTVLSACGGGGSDSSDNSYNDDKKDPSSDSKKDQDNTPKKSSLEISINNLQGEIIIPWQGQQLVFTQEKSSALLDTEGEFTDPINYRHPTFQDCSNYSRSTETDENGNITNTLEINCDDIIPHDLRVGVENLRQELTVLWGDKTITLDEANPIAVATSEAAGIEAVSLGKMPELQDCEITSMSDASSTHAILGITCLDHLATQVVETSPLPFPVAVRKGDNEYVLTDYTTLPESSRLDELKLARSGGTQGCRIERGEFSEEENTQYWTLNCREFVVHVNNQHITPGVYLTFEDGEEYLLEAGNFKKDSIFPVLFGRKMLAISKQFGMKNLQNSNNTISWTDIPGIPTIDLIDYKITSEAAYLLFRGEDANIGKVRDVIYRVDENLSPQKLLDTKEVTGSAVAQIIPVLPKDDVIALEYLRSVADREENERRVGIFEKGELKRSLTLPALKANPVQVVRASGYDILIQPNDLDTGKNINRINDIHLINRTHGDDTLIRTLTQGVDSEINMVNWQFQDGSKAAFAAGKYLFNASSQVAELRLEIDAISKIGLWEETELGTDRQFDYMGSDGKLLVITEHESTLEHGLAELFIPAGRVNLETLYNDAGITRPVRIQSTQVLIDTGQIADAKFLTRPVIVNGWLLLYSGSDEDGSIWMTNGIHTWQVTANSNWGEFQEYSLQFAGTYMAVVKDHNGDIVIFNERER